MKPHVPARPASQGTWSSRGQCDELWERTFAVAATREDEELAGRFWA